MKTFLEQLYYGNVNPSEHYVRYDDEYKRSAGKLADLVDEFFSRLDGDERILWDRLSDAASETEALAEKDAFLCGVRFGARFMLEVMGVEL